MRYFGGGHRFTCLRQANGMVGVFVASLRKQTVSLGHAAHFSFLIWVVGICRELFEVDDR